MSDEEKRVMVDQQPAGKLPRGLSRGKLALTFVGVILVGVLLLGGVFAAGIFTGMKTGDEDTSTSTAESYNWGANVKIDGKEVAVVDFLDDTLQAENMKKNLEFLTQYPHIAGEEENYQLALSLYNEWSKYNFDKVELVNYTVYLSYANQSNPNVLLLEDSSGDVLYNASTAQEPPLTPGENNESVARPFNAYSGLGSVSGPLVYVNFGRFEDFYFLSFNLSLDLTGYICIVRYGNIFRGNKALLAEQFGCAGVLIYSDPQEYAPRDGPPVYPNGPSLPPGGVQRGSLLLPPGDPLTPGIPAIDGVYRRDYQEAINQSIVTSIPTQPISYGDAIHFMKQLSRYEAPDDWVGQLNITYYIIQEQDNTNITYLQVNNYQEERMIYDVIGTIYGSVEPDRYVVLGNHIDAWVFGAVDPNSGTAQLMEIARGFGELRQKGNWRPGRTIILCGWDAEEMSITGSTEWVENRGKLLGANTVAYLNVDSGVSGNLTFFAQATPLLYSALFQATKMVKSENPGFDTVYDEWLYYSNTSYNGTLRPMVYDLGSGSDFTPFLQSHGISSSSMSFLGSSGYAYAVYHSVHDNFFWMTHFGDPTFTHHLAMGLVWSKMAILVATTPVLPYDPRHYALAVERIYERVESEYGAALEEQNITLAYLSNSVHGFTQSTVNLWQEIEAATSSPTENVVRILNNKLMNIERAFILPEGIPGRPYYKHVIFAPSAVNSYGSSLFPGISDTIFNATYRGQTWNDVRRQIDVVRVHLLYASQIMDEPSLKYVQ